MNFFQKKNPKWSEFFPSSQICLTCKQKILWPAFPPKRKKRKKQTASLFTQGHCVIASRFKQYFKQSFTSAIQMRVFTFLLANALCLLTLENHETINLMSKQDLVPDCPHVKTEKSHIMWNCLSLVAHGGGEAAQLEVVVECVLEQMGLLRESSLWTALVTSACLHTVVNSWTALCVDVHTLSSWSQEIVKLCRRTVVHCLPSSKYNVVVDKFPLWNSLWNFAPDGSGRRTRCTVAKKEIQWVTVLL